MIRTGWAGTVIKYILTMVFIIVFWEVGTWIISLIFAIPTGQVNVGGNTLTISFGLQADMSWYGWKSWLIYGWNTIPILAFIGNTLWLWAKSQEKDTAQVEYQQPLGPL